MWIQASDGTPHRHCRAQRIDALVMGAGVCSWVPDVLIGGKESLGGITLTLNPSRTNAGKSDGAAFCCCILVFSSSA